MKRKQKGRPKQGDRSDRRCAFICDRPGPHALGPRPEEHWCHGCQFYICDACDSPEGPPWGGHEVIEHEAEA